MEDCREGKELKQSTCRYVKECRPGWTRNEKFICRKTARRLVSPDEPVRKFTTARKLSRINENESRSNTKVRSFTTKGKPKEKSRNNSTSKVRSFTTKGKSNPRQRKPKTPENINL